MKKIKKASLLIASLLFITVAFPSPIHASSIKTAYINVQAENWDYPTLPGDEKWKTLDTQTAITLCKMPDELLDFCSTEHLADLVLDYPYNLDILASNTIEDGFANLMLKSNIHREFFSRPEAIDIFIEKYGEVEVDYDLLKEQKLQNGKSALRESKGNKEIFAQLYLNFYFDTLSTSQISRLNQLMKKKYTSVRSNSSEFSLFSGLLYHRVQSSISGISNEVSTGNALNSIAHKTQTVQVSNFLNYTFIPEVDENNQPVIYECPAFALTLNTNHTDFVEYINGVITHERYGDRSVNCQKYIVGFDNEITRFLNNDYNTNHPNLTYISSSTVSYNCHSYAWVQSSSSNQYWVDDPSGFIISNLEYVIPRSTSNSANVNCYTAQGDNVVFRLSDGTASHSVVVHSGSTNASTTTVWAKMGIYGLYAGSLREMLNIYLSTNTYDVYDTVY